jgi:microcystin-dependent protein
MADPFLGELSVVGFNFAPINWALAQGQLLPISRYTALFSLLGTNFGGDGKSTFGLPNMQAAVPIGMGQGSGLSNYFIGEEGGSQYVTLLQNETPIHTHPPMAVESRADKTAPIGNSFAESTTGNLYSSASPTTLMNPGAISLYGSGQPHNNMMPYLGMYWIICMQGVFPTRS